jgi:superfamily II DNA or RNA helicase
MQSSRDYQVACADAILKLWGIAPWAGMSLWRRHAELASALGRAPWAESDGPHRSLIAAIGTAGGKTVVAANLIGTLTGIGARILYCGDTDELVQQPIEKIAKITGIFPTLEKADARALPGPTSPVCVASVQTLADPHRLEEFARRWGIPDFIIHDEAHTAPARAARINARFPNAKILGLTATPFRANASNLNRWYELEAFRMDAGDLESQGWVAPLSVQGIDLGLDFDELLAAQYAAPDSDPHKVARRIEPVYRRIAQILRTDFSKRSVLVFHPLIKSSELFTEICLEEGLTAAHCDGETKSRVQIVAGFDRGDIRVVSNSGVFTQGVDFIRADCLLNLALTRSAGQFRQRAGRVMRVLPGVIDGIERAADRRQAIFSSTKPDALILDILGQTQRLGLAGASAIVGRNKDERNAISKAVSRDPQSLTELQAEVVRKREDAILHALRNGHGQPVMPQFNGQESSGIMEFPRGRFEPESKEAKLDALFASLMD